MTGYNVAEDLEGAQKYQYEHDSPMGEVDLMNTDIKINPPFYIHLAIVRQQNTLLMPDLKDGMLRYIFFTEYIEMLVRASEMLPNDYTEQIDNYKASDDYKTTAETARNMKLANFKLNILMRQFFRRQPLTGNLRY